MNKTKKSFKQQDFGLLADVGELRTTGGWREVSGKGILGHYFVARNPSLNTAISLCQTEIVGFDKIHPAMSGKKCAVCAAYVNAGKEVQYRLIEKADEKLEKIEVEEYLRGEGEEPNISISRKS